MYKNPTTYAKVATGAVAAANYLYDVFQSYPSYFTNSGNYTEDLSKSQTLSKKMGRYKGFSKTFKKFKKRKFDMDSKKKKKLWKKKKMKKFKRQAKYFEKVDTMTQPYSIETSEEPQSWVSSGDGATGNSNIYSVECGLSRNGTQTSATNFLWNATDDDLWHAYKTAFQGQTVTRVNSLHQNEHIMVDKLTTKFCIRNNTNIGCKVEVYHVKRKFNNATSESVDVHAKMRDSLIQAMKDSFNPPTTDAVQNSMSYSETLFDYPEVCRRYTLKLVKSYIHYPAVTKFFNLTTPFAGYARTSADAFRYTADPRWHRALVFVIKGLPVHANTDASFAPGFTAYGGWKLDVIISRKMKVRRIAVRTNDDHHNPNSTRITNILYANQEIQPAVNPDNTTIES